MKPKMRVTLLDEQFVVQEDRLVDQYTELLAGPKGKHDGPIRLEVVIHDEWGFNKFKEYLDQLKGLIPLAKPKERGVKAKPGSVNPYKEIFNDIKGKTHIEDVIEYLDKINFRFASPQLLEDRGIQIEGEAPKGYQPMLRVMRYAKDPANDKFDSTMIVWISIMGKPKDKVIVYYKGEMKKAIAMTWKKASNINLKEKKIPMLFPEFMTIEERKHWRYIRRKVELSRPIANKDQKFYDRYKPDIKNLNEGKGFNL